MIYDYVSANSAIPTDAEMNRQSSPVIKIFFKKIERLLQTAVTWIARKLETRRKRKKEDQA